MKDRVLGEEEEMEVKSSLRRAHSLKNVSSDRVLSWTESGLRDKRKSVSQLVAQYQKSPGGKTKESVSGEVKNEMAMQISPVPVSENDVRVETLLKNSDVKEKPRVSLSRSKSMESLSRHRPTGTSALRALFESKVTNKSSGISLASTGAEKSQNKDAEITKSQVEVNNSHDEQVKVTEEVQVIIKTASTKKVISRSDRRKTISGISVEKRSTPEEDKRRSVADFRDNSALCGQEKPSISVKALSALYLSKVAAAEPAGNLLKPDQNPPSPTGKRPKTNKMAEGAQNGIACSSESNPPTSHLETSLDEHERPFTSPPPTREAITIQHQHRQKCELKRLLKHTYPELKNIDSLIEAELADILNIDPNTDTSCQTDVQSRCWMFENHEKSSVDLQKQTPQEKNESQDGDIKKTVCMFEQPMSNSYKEENKHQLSESEEVTSEQSIKVDVKATRKMFETQTVAILKDIQSPGLRKKNVSEEKIGLDHKARNVSESDGKETSNIQHDSQTNDFIYTNEVFLGISKAKQIFETMPHDKENISPTNDSFREEELLIANVRNRAQMFESTPLDKINQQTKDDAETILADTQETLVSLCNFSIIHSDGTLLEANETGHVKKARYHIVEEGTRPEIEDEEIVTGSIKSVMLHMLPGANLNPTVTYLKEDSQGNVEIQKVDVPVHQLPFTQDKECRTANVVQITEDLLSQETSLRKGVLIQVGTTGMREITVYALFIRNEDSAGVEFGKIESRSISSNLRNISGSKNVAVASNVGLSESSFVINTITQLFTVKDDADHLKSLREISSSVDIGVSTGESEETSVPGNVNDIKASFPSSDDNVQSDENKTKVSTTGSLINNTVETNQAENCLNLKHEGILPNQNITEEGAVLQAELVDVVEDDELVNLQTAIMNLQKATIEAKALQQSVQAKQVSQIIQAQPICDPGSVSHEITQIKNDDDISEKEELSQISKTEQEEKSKEDEMKGCIQAALDSLGKSNFNVTKGDFRAAMIYRNSGKDYAVHKKMDVDPSSDRTKDNKPSASTPKPQDEQETFKSPGEGTDTSPCENKLVMSSPSQVSVDMSAKIRKTPVGPKPALPPKPEHLKSKPNPTGAKICIDSNKVPATSLNVPAEQIKESSNPKPNPGSHEEKSDIIKSEPCCTFVTNAESSENKMLDGVQVVEETSESPKECTANDSSTGLHATLQNFGVKPSGSVAPVKPKRIKMAKEIVKNTTESTSINSPDSEIAEGITPSPNDNDSLGETCKADSNCCKEKGNTSDEQITTVVRRKKKMRAETENERRQRLSVHMDEIMKVNVPAVMEIFDKLKKQEELKTILSKVEEIEEDTNKVDVSSLKNIFESVPDWVVPQEKIIKPEVITPEHLGAPSEPEMMTSMEVAFGDLEKAGAEIIRLKDQTLAKLMDIEEAIKKALYSVSTLKSDSDIAGLSGLFRESMVQGSVQGSPPAGNIRKISIGSSRSPRAQIGRSHQSTTQNKPELFIPTTKQRSSSPASPSFISIQSAARKPSESPSPQINPLKEEAKEEAKPQCCCSVPLERRQCSVTKAPSSSPATPRRQVSVLEVKTRPEAERFTETKTVSENYERTDSFGNKFYSSKTSTVVTTQPETRTSSKKLVVSSPATSEIVTYPNINTPFIREDHPPL